MREDNSTDIEMCWAAYLSDFAEISRIEWLMTVKFDIWIWYIVTDLQDNWKSQSHEREQKQHWVMLMSLTNMIITDYEVTSSFRDHKLALKDDLNELRRNF